jgi:hypothetical protein
MRRNETQDQRQSCPINCKQTSIGIGTGEAMQKKRQREFRQKHEEHNDKMSLRGNMPQMTQEEMLERQNKTRVALKNKDQPDYERIEANNRSLGRLASIRRSIRGSIAPSPSKCREDFEVR